MKYGYTRTSTDDQTTALQLAALKRARCSHIFEDKGVSGATAKRPALLRCLGILRPGDTLIVWKLTEIGYAVEHGVGGSKAKERKQAGEPGGALHKARSFDIRVCQLFN